jgi:hypothetical protein
MEDNSEMNLTEAGCEGVDWVQWRTFLNADSLQANMAGSK